MTEEMKSELAKYALKIVVLQEENENLVRELQELRDGYTTEDAIDEAYERGFGDGLANPPEPDADDVLRAFKDGYQQGLDAAKLANGVQDTERIDDAPPVPVNTQPVNTQKDEVPYTGEWIFKIDGFHFATAAHAIKKLKLPSTLYSTVKGRIEDLNGMKIEYNDENAVRAPMKGKTFNAEWRFKCNGIPYAKAATAAKDLGLEGDQINRLSGAISNYSKCWHQHKLEYNGRYKMRRRK